jgi:alkylation response protein AidB-like acyl-CoA dehydrogenase
LNIAARSVGIAARAYEEAVKYAKSRMAFGKSISEFQAIQLKIADMATDLQAARLLTYWAASEADQGKRVDLQTAQAKVFASEVAIQNSLRAMQVHGGYGYSTEYEIERLYRDAPLMSIGEGTNDIMRMVIAKQIFAD